MLWASARARPLHRLRRRPGQVDVRSRGDARRDHRPGAAARLVSAGHAGHPLVTRRRRDRQRRARQEPSRRGHVRRARRVAHRCCAPTAAGSDVAAPTRTRTGSGATVGGLGLTGLIASARLRLRRSPGAWIDVDIDSRSRRSDEFFALSEKARRRMGIHGGVDRLRRRCARRGHARLFFAGNHAAPTRAGASRGRARGAADAAVSLVSQLSVRAFNRLLPARPSRPQSAARQHYRRFFYPLDGVRDWNRIYGPRGFYQYQCVVPRQCRRRRRASCLRGGQRSGHRLVPGGA